jgi:hypothetical protein
MIQMNSDRKHISLECEHAEKYFDSYYISFHDLYQTYLHLYILLLIGYNFYRVLPASITWMKYLSQFYYSNEALAVLHWQEVDYISKYQL